VFKFGKCSNCNTSCVSKVCYELVHTERLARGGLYSKIYSCICARQVTSTSAILQSFSAYLSGQSVERSDSHILWISIQAALHQESGRQEKSVRLNVDAVSVRIPLNSALQRLGCSSPPHIRRHHGLRPFVARKYTVAPLFPVIPERLYILGNFAAEAIFFLLVTQFPVTTAQKTTTCIRVITHHLPYRYHPRSHCCRVRRR